MKIRNALILALLALLVANCKTIQYVPVETVKEVAVHDTTKIHVADTLVKIPDVSIGDFIDLEDTLHLRADFASADAWVDPEHGILAGRLVQGGKLPVQVQWKERTVFRDSITTKEIPVPVEVERTVVKIPLLYKIFSAVGLLSVLCIGIHFALKMKKPL